MSNPVSDSIGSSLWAFVGAAVTVLVAWINARVRPAAGPETEWPPLFAEARRLLAEAKEVGLAAQADLAACQEEREAMNAELDVLRSEIRQLHNEIVRLRTSPSAP